MSDDHELLRRYATEGAQEAFTELVHRHVDLVHSAALRQVNGNAQLAADATQLVFTDLARKAGTLAGHRVLAGWLFTSVRYAARNLVRGEQRRHDREKQAFAMEDMIESEAPSELDWQRLRPVLDDVMNELGRADREVVLLRFFEGRDYAEVGAKLNLPANTARMRVERALEKLRARLERRGIASTSAALAAALTGSAVMAAPAGLATAVSGAALAGGTATVTGTLALALMSVTKTQMGAAAALMAAGVGGFWVQAGAINDGRAELAALRQENRVAAQLRADNDRLARAAAEAADLRLDDALLTQLSDDATALQAQWRKIAAAERAKAALPPPLTGRIYDLSLLDRAPQARAQVRPAYPVQMRRDGIGGRVVVNFVVDTEGAVRNAKVEESTRSEFEAAAIEALSQWKFSPPVKGGNKVNARVSVPVVFSINNEARGPLPAWWF